MKLHTMKRFLSSLAPIGACAILLFSGGCANIPERNPLPIDLSSEATIPGIPELRF